MSHYSSLYNKGKKTELMLFQPYTVLPSLSEVKKTYYATFLTVCLPQISVKVEKLNLPLIP